MSTIDGLIFKTECKILVVVAKTCRCIVLYHTAEVYVALGKDAEASACVLEATLIFPLSPDVLFQVSQFDRLLFDAT